MEPALRANGGPAPRRDFWLGVLLFASVLAVYFPADWGGRLLDDDLHLTQPSLRSLGGLRRIWFHLGATQQYYPVVHTAFWLEHRLWGDAVVGYHLVNVLLHGLAALLVLVLARRLRLPGGWLAAFVFALHPVCVESVAWIAEQKNTLSAVFALGAAIAYVRFDEDRDRPRYALALGLFALALLSKTAVVTLPAALLAVIWWRRSRLAWRRDVVPLLPWFALGGLVALATLAVEQDLLAAVRLDFPLSWLGRVLLAGRILWFYLGRLLWPAGLTFFYPRWTVSPDEGWQYLYPLGAAAVAVGFWLLGPRSRGPLAAFLCFAGILLPVLGFFNIEWFVFSYVADHLEYFASLGVIVPLAAFFSAAAARLPHRIHPLAPLFAAGLAAVLGILSWRQCRRYADPVVFYRTAAELNPASAAAHDNLGAVLSALPGYLPEAISEYERALQIEPRVPQGHEDLGTALLRDPRRRGAAAAQFAEALRLQPDRKSARRKLALAWSGLPGRLPEAIAQYRVLLAQDPSDPQLHDGLGLALARTPGGLDAGITEYREALRLKPDFAEAHNDLGLALARSGRLGDAIAEFQEALRLEPELAGAHNNLGLAWTMLPGRMNDAIAQFQAALRLDPTFAPGWHSLGLAWARIGDLPAAAEAFRQELRLAPDNPAARQALAEATHSGAP
jgi:tetratricopeptide (TPR) repeat protein